MAFELGIVRSGSSEFIAQPLPDGSMALFEVATKNVYSLNPSAAAAWEACASATTLSQVAAAMSRQLNRPVTEELAHEAVDELAAVGLVTVTPGERLGTSRRQLLKQAAEVGVPLVLVLTGAEQRAHAQGAGSGPTTTLGPGTTSTTTAGPTTTTTTAGPTTTTTAGPTTTTTTAAPLGRTGTFILDKFLAASFSEAAGRTPLQGAEFDVVSVATGQVVGHLVTDANGRATITLNLGESYTIVETFAPPSLNDYIYPNSTLPHTFEMFKDGTGRDFNNVLKPPASG